MTGPRPRRLPRPDRPGGQGRRLAAGLGRSGPLQSAARRRPPAWAQRPGAVCGLPQVAAQDQPARPGGGLLAGAAGGAAASHRGGADLRSGLDRAELASTLHQLGLHYVIRTRSNVYFSSQHFEGLLGSLAGRPATHRDLGMGRYRKTKPVRRGGLSSGGSGTTRSPGIWRPTSTGVGVRSPRSIAYG